MFGFLFLLVIDWVIRKTVEGGQTKIKWQFTNTLQDVDFTNDISLVASRNAEMQTKVNNLINTNGKKIGNWKINLGKTVIMMK